MFKYVYHLALAILLFFMNFVYGQSNTTALSHFDKVIVSPHIEVTFKEGNKEAISIDSARLPEEKINIEVSGKTLHIYLDGAKMVTKTKKGYHENGWKQKKPIYKGTMMTATVTYTQLKELSIRGEEIITCESPIQQEDFKLKVYGEPKVTMNSITVNSLFVTMYGEGNLEILKGKVERQKYTVYGEGEINTMGMTNQNTKITAYGEANFRVHVSEKLKVSAFGEATVVYNGNPSVQKGIIIGEATIQKID
ncbi:head GIN domain-containing protein [Aquimarina sp. 2201CG1-2-11]|uniref:head GIN domain-containing protein n=1 Tax=Aquimarina discodermiae TaxID=3231043 RepID=UPI00346223B2